MDRKLMCKLAIYSIPILITAFMPRFGGQSPLYASEGNQNNGEEKAQAGDTELLRQAEQENVPGLLTSIAAAPITLENLTEVQQLAYFDPVGYSFRDLVWAPDGSVLAFAGSNAVYFVTAESLNVEGSTNFEIIFGVTPDQIAYSPDGRTFAVAHEVNNQMEITLYDFTNFNPEAAIVLIRLTGHQDRVVELVYSPDGSTLAAGIADGTVMIWDTATGDQVAKLDGFGNEVDTTVYSSDGSEFRVLSADTLLKTTVYSPDGASLAAYAANDFTVRLYDLATGEERNSLEFTHSENELHSIESFAFSPDGMIAAAAKWDEIALFDVTTGELLRVFSSEATDRPYNGLVFNSDGAALVAISSAAGGRSVVTFDTQTGDQRAIVDAFARFLIPSPASDFALSPISGQPFGDGLHVFNTTTGALLLDIPFVNESQDFIFEAVFSPDGSLIAVTDQTSMWLFGILN